MMPNLDARPCFSGVQHLRAWTLTLGAALCASAWAQPASAPIAVTVPQHSVHLTQGDQTTLQPVQTPGRIAVSDPDVVDVKVIRNRAKGANSQAQLLLTGKIPGASSVQAWPQRGGPVQRWNIQVGESQLILDKSLHSLQEHAAFTAAYSGLDMPVTDQSRVDVHSDTVQVEVQVVEFKKSALKKAGINLQSGRNNQLFQFSSLNPSTQDGDSPIADAMNLVLKFGRAFSGSGLDARLSLLEGNGMVRVLAKPTLVAHSGQSASFLAGGEIPIPVSGNDGNIAIEYKEFGVKLNLTPTVLSNDRIALRVAPEASDLDLSSGVEVSGVRVPSIRTRRADTMVELGNGESFVIGGLVSRNTMSQVNKVPLIGDIPILGTFFRNLNYSQDETELVIIVTPHLVHPLAAGTNLQNLLPGAHREFPNAGNVWGQHIVGGWGTNGTAPGFSY